MDNQKRIYAVLSSMTKKIEIEKMMLEHYIAEKRYLLRQMFI
ncbi:restriction endonuclease subunit S domain-containing protein [Bacteroides zoogleoformans]|nr:hypothetical protein [Bacteroides zoogleoformans]